ncbi:MAG: patatin-like phospholipase family protein [Rhizomicrobium sp.]
MDTKTGNMSTENMVGWRPERCGRVALVLQGGGALGAYQAGVYQALHEGGIEPDWVSGVSIGAVNAAIIAGNKPEDRLEKLTTFWTRITDRTVWLHTPDGDIFRQMRNATSSFYTTLLGQPGFFKPQKVSPWLSPAGAKSATGYYDNSPLRETLLELVDFNLLNSKGCRFSVGAVNVMSGNFIFFDNAKHEIGPEHIMASGALPPAFSPVQIGTDYFWDGGIVSNTPLQHLLAQDDDINSLVFQVDLFSASGALPRTIQDVMSREKDIAYSSRTRQVTDMFQRLQRWKTRAYRALLKVPEADLTDDERKMRDKLATLSAFTVLQLIYQQKTYEGNAKDYEFSRTSMREHWDSGHGDTKRTLTHRHWLEMPPENTGIVTHDIHRDREEDVW